MDKLDREEKEILESFEQGEWKSAVKSDAQFQRYQNYAKATYKTEKRVNIRISRKDIEAIQKKALEDGIPYQTLITSILHKYAAGRLVEKERLQTTG